MIFFLGYTVTEIANHNKVSRQAVNQMKNRASENSFLLHLLPDDVEYLVRILGRLYFFYLYCMALLR